MKILPTLLITVTIIGLIGCANPFNHFLKTTSKIDKTEQKIEKENSKQNDLSKGYVYGANLALNKETNNSIPIKIAKDFTDKSLVITGLPSAKEVDDFRKIVEGKISTNIVENKYAEELLNIKNKQIIELEEGVAKLQQKLNQQEEQFKEEARKNAQDAQLMATIKRWLRFSFIGIGIIIILRIVSLFMPALAPIGFILDSTVGGLFKIATKILPQAKKAAGVVAEDVHNLSEKTLKQVIEAIQIAKEQYPEVKEKLAPIFQNITDKETTRVKILDVKKELGYI